MAKDPVSIKLSAIKYEYGKAEAEYFKNNPVCETCGEARLVTLSIHHIHGKKINKFKTLCHNCHAVAHAVRSGQATFQDSLDKINNKKIQNEKINKQIKYMSNKGYSLRAIGRELKLSHNTIRNRLNAIKEK